MPISRRRHGPPPTSNRSARPASPSPAGRQRPCHPVILPVRRQSNQQTDRPDIIHRSHPQITKQHGILICRRRRANRKRQRAHRKRKRRQWRRLIGRQLDQKKIFRRCQSLPGACRRNSPAQDLEPSQAVKVNTAIIKPERDHGPRPQPQDDRPQHARPQLLKSEWNLMPGILTFPHCRTVGPIPIIKIAGPVLHKVDPALIGELPNKPAFKQNSRQRINLGNSWQQKPLKH